MSCMTLFFDKLPTLIICCPNFVEAASPSFVVGCGFPCIRFESFGSVMISFECTAFSALFIHLQSISHVYFGCYLELSIFLNFG